MFWSSLLSSLLWLTLAQFDPLGVKTAANLQSESVFIRLVGGPWYKSDAQDRITVVLIDDNYLDQVDEPWPMSYMHQDLLLSNILDHNPRAVFIDLLYRHKHGDTEQLAETIRQAQSKRSIPIFIPYLVHEGSIGCPNKNEKVNFLRPIEMENSVIKEMRDSEAHKVFIGWTGCGNKYPSFIPQNYQYKTPSSFIQQNHKTPSFALFQAFCKNPAETLKGCRDIRSNDLEQFTQPMKVNWGSGVSERQRATFDRAGIKCPQIDKHSFMSKLHYQWEQLRYMAGQLSDSTTERGKIESCTYTDTIHATWFLGSSPELHADLKERIENRIVLIGTEIEGVHDYVISPVNGTVPGVYLFAMALDNYLEYGAGYIKEFDKTNAILIEIVALLGIMLIIGSIWHAIPVQWKCRAEGIGFFEASGRVLTIFLIFKLLIPIAISLIIAFVMWEIERPPMNWIGVSLLSFIVNPVKLKDCIRAAQRS